MKKNSYLNGFSQPEVTEQGNIFVGYGDEKYL